MAIAEYRDRHNMTWQQVARELSALSPEPIYYRRLWELRLGRGKPVTDTELQALRCWSRGELNNYKG